ncbi:MAG: hypothetical protein ACLQIB_25820 [Isosphaeraceae bacterium]
MSGIKLVGQVSTVFLLAFFAMLLVGIDETGARNGITPPETGLGLVRGRNLNNYQNPTPTDCSKYVNAPGYVPDFLCAQQPVNTPCVSCKDQYYNNMIPFGGGSTLNQQGTHNCALFTYYFGTCNSAGTCAVPQGAQPQGQCTGTIPVWDFETQ